MKQIILCTLVLALIAGCGGGGKQVTRLDPNSQTDLSGRWNDTDARLVARELIDDCLSRPWLDNHVKDAGKQPVVTVGTFSNETSEHINVDIFIEDFERELLNSGRVQFAAGKPYRAELRQERQEQQEFASRETVKKMRNETGADYMLFGSVKTITDQEGNKQTVFYSTDAELINIETMLIVWKGNKKIKKGISQGKTKW